ncbi:hypothetical protein B4Q13_18810 [Lacticaseibacillus rhamnosus]
MAWTSWIYGTTFPVLMLVYTLVRLGIRGLPQLWAAWPVLLLGVAVSFALVLPLAQPYFEARMQGETYQHMFAIGDGLTTGIVTLYPDRVPRRPRAPGREESEAKPGEAASGLRV